MSRSTHVEDIKNKPQSAQRYTEQNPQSENQTMNEAHDPLMPRPVRDSISEMNEFVLPNDANPLGALLGGRLMHWIDMAGALAAHRHSRNYVVTASIDHLDFWTPVHVGDLVVLRSSVNRVFTTSMEVGVTVWVENYLADETRQVSSAYLTFVAVDAAGRHLKVTPVIPETDDEKRRYEDAGRRREIRKAERQRRQSNARLGRMTDGRMRFEQDEQDHRPYPWGGRNRPRCKRNLEGTPSAIYLYVCDSDRRTASANSILLLHERASSESRSGRLYS